MKQGHKRKDRRLKSANLNYQNKLSSARYYDVMHGLLRSTRVLLGSIFAALSCLVGVPPREEPSEEEGGLLSRTAAGDRV